MFHKIYLISIVCRFYFVHCVSYEIINEIFALTCQSRDHFFVLFLAARKRKHRKKFRFFQYLYNAIVSNEEIPFLDDFGFMLFDFVFYQRSKIISNKSSSFDRIFPLYVSMFLIKKKKTIKSNILMTLYVYFF